MNPRGKKGVPALPKDWLRYAKSDLKLAKLGLNEDVLPEQICFHTQQSVEKALKAVLLFCNIDFPFTHDIDELLDTLEGVGISTPSVLSEAGILTPYAVEARYPGYWGEISEDDVANAITLAEKAIVWAGEFIQKD